MPAASFSPFKTAKARVMSDRWPCPGLALDLHLNRYKILRTHKFDRFLITSPLLRVQSRTIAATLRRHPPSDQAGPEIGESVTLLVLLAVPSFFALCFLAVAHTFQTMNLRLAESAPFPSEALLREYFPIPPAFQAAQSVAARVPAYERLLQNYPSRSTRFALYRESNLRIFMRLPVTASFLRAHRRSWPDSSLRTAASPDARYKRSPAPAIFSRRRTRLSAPARRSRSFSAPLMSYS